MIQIVLDVPALYRRDVVSKVYSEPPVCAVRENFCEQL